MPNRVALEDVSLVGVGAGGDGVTGTTGGATAAAVHGTNTGSGVGVQGETSGATAAGVLGTHHGAGIGAGVSGVSDAGTGVVGTSGGGSGFGVLGTNTGSGVGVRGECAAGLGVLAIGAVALEVHGPAVFTRSGVLTVAAGKSSATQTGVALTTSSLVLATMQQDKTGLYVRSAVPNVTGSSFTINLSKAVTASITVAWFVVN